MGGTVTLLDKEMAQTLGNPGDEAMPSPPADPIADRSVMGDPEDEAQVRATSPFCAPSPATEDAPPPTAAFQTAGRKDAEKQGADKEWHHLEAVEERAFHAEAGTHLEGEAVGDVLVEATRRERASLCAEEELQTRPPTDFGQQPRQFAEDGVCHQRRGNNEPQERAGATTMIPFSENQAVMENGAAMPTQHEQPLHLEGDVQNSHASEHAVVAHQRLSFEQELDRQAQQVKGEMDERCIVREKDGPEAQGNRGQFEAEGEREERVILHVIEAPVMMATSLAVDAGASDALATEMPMPAPDEAVAPQRSADMASPEQFRSQLRRGGRRCFRAVVPEVVGGLCQSQDMRDEAAIAAGAPPVPSPADFHAAMQDAMQEWFCSGAQWPFPVTVTNQAVLKPAATNAGTIPCRHWLRGRCNLGDDCNFAHVPVLDLSSQLVVPFGSSPEDALLDQDELESPRAALLRLCGAWGALATRKPLRRSRLLRYRHTVLEGAPPLRELQCLRSIDADEFPLMTQSV